MSQLSTRILAGLFTIAALCSGCTIIKYEKGDVKFTHISPIFVKRDVREIDLLQGKMSGYAGTIDPQTIELINAATEGAVRAALKASVKP